MFLNCYELLSPGILLPINLKSSSDQFFPNVKNKLLRVIIWQYKHLVVNQLIYAPSTHVVLTFIRYVVPTLWTLYRRRNNVVRVHGSGYWIFERHTLLNCTQTNFDSVKLFWTTDCKIYNFPFLILNSNNQTIQRKERFSSHCVTCQLQDDWRLSLSKDATSPTTKKFH